LYHQPLHKNTPDMMEVKLNPDQIFRQSHDPRIVESNWRKLVKDYSARVQNLTYPSDIFPAVQGLAEIVPPFMGSYYAGHWEKYLPSSLGWKVIYRASQPRPKEWRAPSWSWASVDDPISWVHHDDSPVHTGDEHPFLQILRVNTVPKGSDPTGQLWSGEIVVTAKCLSGNVSYDSSLDANLAGVIFNVDHAQSNTYRIEKGVFWDYHIDSAGPEHVADGAPVIAIKLGSGRRYWQWMILRPIEGEHVIYERIGLLQSILVHPELYAGSVGEVLDKSHERLSREHQLTII
jgi:hypothetical protein